MGWVAGFSQETSLKSLLLRGLSLDLAAWTRAETPASTGEVRWMGWVAALKAKLKQPPKPRELTARSSKQ